MSKIIAVKKDHEVIKTIKSLINNSKPNNLLLIEDLFSLQLIIKQKLDTNLIKGFVYCNELAYSDEVKMVINYMNDHLDYIYTISKKTLDSLLLKDNYVGLMAIIEFNYKSLNDLNSDVVLVLDRLENPGNVGTLLRTCDSCGIKDIILCDPVCKINHVKAIQSSRGTILLTNIYKGSYEEIQDCLLNKGYDIYLGEPELGSDYQSYKYHGKCALVIGHERFGINPNWYNHPHKAVHIPQAGVVSSLNVGVAGSILLYEIYMKKRDLM